MRSSKLRISSSFSFPHEVSTETLCAVGKRGTGKTNAIVCLVEEMHGAGLPFVVIDPTGVWWGLRLDKNGKDPGLDVIIFGGDHGDVDLEETAGAVVADFVIESHRACILDLSGFRKGQAVRFMTDFAERLYHAKGKAKHRDALHVIIDEADAYAPQRPMPDTARLLGAIEDLIRRGRSRGIGMSLITQRPAVLNKNVMAQTEVLMAFQLTAPLDQKAIREWVHVNAEEEKLKMLEHDLATAKQGDCYIWSPSWLNVSEWVHIRERRTFDSSATPKAGAKRIVPKDLPPVDLDALRASFAETIEKKKANDPNELKKEIARLKKSLESESNRKPAEARVENRFVEVPTIPEELQKAILTLNEIGLVFKKSFLKTLEQIFGDGFKDIEAQMTEVRKALERAQKEAKRPAKFKANGEWSTPKQLEEPKVRTAVAYGGGVSDREPAVGGKIGGGGATIILQCAASLPRGVSRNQLTVLCKVKRSSRDAYILRLKGKGLIEEKDVNGEQRIFITDAGRSTLGPGYDRVKMGLPYRKWWMARLQKSELEILNHAIEVYPDSFTREDVGALLGNLAVSSRNAYIQRLTAKGLIVDMPEGLFASEDLFDAA